MQLITDTVTEGSQSFTEQEHFISWDLTKELESRELHYVPPVACEELLTMCSEITPQLWDIVEAMDVVFSKGSIRCKKQVMHKLPPLARYYVLKHYTASIQSSVVTELYKLPANLISMLEEE